MGDSARNSNSVEVKQYSASIVCLELEKFRLIHLVDSVRSNKKPDWSILFIPIGLIIGVLPSLITDSFSDWLTVPKTVWSSLFAFILLASIVIFVILLVNCIRKSIKHDKRSSEQIVDDLIKDYEDSKRKPEATYTSNALNFERKLRQQVLSNYLQKEFSKQIQSSDKVYLIDKTIQFLEDSTKAK